MPLLITLALFLQTSHADEVKKAKCEGWFRRTLTSMGQGWRQFRRDVREQGKIRYVLAPRPEGSRFNAWAAAIDPLIDLPIEAVSYASAKYFDRPLKRRLSIFTSIPVGLVVWGAVFVGLDIKSDQWGLESLEKGVSDDISGAGYASEYVLSGAISPSEGARIVGRHHADTLHGLDSLRMRADQFKNLNIWRPEQVVTFNEILNELQGQYKPAELTKRADLERVLLANKKYQVLARSIPAASRYTLKLLIEPRIFLHNRSDAYWLSLFFEPFRNPQMTREQMKGLGSIENIYKFHSRDLSLATLSYLIAETLGNPEGMNSKLQEAAKLGFDREYDFVYRGNVPLFSQPGEFVDLDRRVPMNTELQRWSVLLKDPRFQIIRTDWQRGEISELTALLRADIQARALSQVYNIAVLKDGKLSTQDACLLIFGKGEGQAANPMFVRLGQAPATLQYQLAENYFSALVEAGGEKTAASYESALARAQVQERGILNSPTKQGSAALQCSQ